MLITSSIPLTISLLIGNLYNLVDSIFVSHVSEEALAALSLAGPIQTIIAALGCGIAIGLNAAVSKALGEQNESKVTATTTAAIFLGFCAWLLLAIGGLTIVRPYMETQSGGNAAITNYGVQYLSICMVFSLGNMMQWVFDRLVIASGRSSLFLYTLSAASITNLILDPIFIFGFGPIPALSTTGAAIATVIGQSVGAIAGILINKRYNRDIPIRFSFHVQKECLLDILQVGIPTAIMQAMLSITGILMNSLLVTYSATAVAVFGISLRIQNTALVLIHGMTLGIISIIAYNYGAKQPDRIRQAIRCIFLYGLSSFAVILLLIQFFPQQLLSMFNASPQMLTIGVPALRLLSAAWMFTGAGMILTSVFQAFGQGTQSMFLTLLRQVVLSVLFLWLFSLTGRLELIWCAFAAAELTALPIGILLLRRTLHTFVVPMEKV